MKALCELESWEPVLFCRIVLCRKCKTSEDLRTRAATYCPNVQYVTRHCMRGSQRGLSRVSHDGTLGKEKLFYRFMTLRDLCLVFPNVVTCPFVHLNVDNPYNTTALASLHYTVPLHRLLQFGGAEYMTTCT